MADSGRTVGSSWAAAGPHGMGVVGDDRSLDQLFMHVNEPFVMAGAPQPQPPQQTSLSTADAAIPPRPLNGTSDAEPSSCFRSMVHTGPDQHQQQQQQQQQLLDAFGFDLLSTSAAADEGADAMNLSSILQMPMLGLHPEPQQLQPTEAPQENDVDLPGGAAEGDELFPDSVTEANLASGASDGSAAAGTAAAASTRPGPFHKTWSLLLPADGGPSFPSTSDDTTRSGSGDSSRGRIVQLSGSGTGAPALLTSIASGVRATPRPAPTGPSTPGHRNTSAGTTTTPNSAAIRRTGHGGTSTPTTPASSSSASPGIARPTPSLQKLPTVSKLRMGGATPAARPATPPVRQGPSLVIDLTAPGNASPTSTPPPSGASGAAKRAAPTSTTTPSDIKRVKSESVHTRTGSSPGSPHPATTNNIVTSYRTIAPQTVKHEKPDSRPSIPLPVLPVRVNLPMPSVELPQPATNTTKTSGPAPWNVLDLTEEDSQPMVVDVDEPDEYVDDQEPTNSDDELLICEVITRIIGMNYYRGDARPQAKVYVVRDSTDEFDTSTIRIKNTSGAIIGNIVTEAASALAPQIDKNIIRLEGRLTSDVTNAFAIPVLLSVYSTSVYEKSLVEYLQKASGIQIRWVRFLNAITNAPKNRPGSSAHSALLAKALVQQDAAKTLEALFEQNQEQQSKLAMAQQPAKITTELLPYQRQGLYWLQFREALSEPEEGEGKRSLFWSVHEDKYTGKPVYYNHLTKVVMAAKPSLALGGILADDMGLGKTIQTISLITDDLYQLRQREGGRGSSVSSQRNMGAMVYSSKLKPISIGGTTDEDSTNADSPATSSGTAATAPKPETPVFDKPTHLTLIVCPVAVVGNWVKQFETHVERSFLSVYVFHGSERTTDVSEFLRHDVIITTYALLANEYAEPEKNTQGSSAAARPDRSRAGPLQQVYWRRVVLDEAHTIKSRRTKQSLAASQLRSERRWCLTGTPIQNELDDLYSLLKFLHIKPFEEHLWWNKLVTRPMQTQEEKGLTVLQELIKEICLRRVKTMQINGAPVLPERNVYLHKIKFRPDEQELYMAMENESRRLMTNYIQQNNLSENYAHVLVILTRLRQLCDHKSLSSHDTRLLLPSTGGSSGAGGVADAKRQQLLNILSDNEIEDCAICQKELRNPVITPCAHLFCRVCIERMISLSDLCPVCRVKLGRNDLISNGNVDDDGMPTDEPQAKKISKKQWNAQNADKLEPSAKIEAIIEYLEATRVKDASIKSLIFSQWTSMLDVVEVFLSRYQIKFTRIDGQMQRKTREENINRFESDASITVMLISLKCGSLGLNLTVASQVFLVDPWWNPATEDQAIDRVHRIGQKRIVNVIRLVMEGTIEERVITLQEKKRHLMEQAFGRGRSEISKEQRIADLKELFAMEQD